MADLANEKLTLGIEYKPEYDTTGEYDELERWVKTFAKVKETASLEQQYAMVDGIVNLTVYIGAPYRRVQTRTAQIIP